MNYADLQFSSFTASLKVAASGKNQLSVPSTSSVVTATVVIPHNAGTTNIVWQVGGYVFDNTTNALMLTGCQTPFTTSDGKYQAVASADDTNLTVELISSTAGTANDAVTYYFTYRVLVI